jgi:SAM-dependent methyltransferase
MNTKIFNLVQKNLDNLLKIQVTPQTNLVQLNWTDGKRKLFMAQLQKQLGVDIRWFETVEQLVDNLTVKYMDLFFGQNWGHTMDQYVQTGWALADVVNSLNPRSVLDVGCGFNLFKGRIKNLTGLDPYNSAADLKIDIRAYRAPKNSHDVILALGSLCYNSRDEVEHEFAHCVDLLETNGKMFMRVNPNAEFSKFPYLEFFEWSPAIAQEFAEKYQLRMETWEQDGLGRFYLVYTKL